MYSLIQNIDHDICDSDEEQVYDIKPNQTMNSMNMNSEKKTVETIRKVNNCFYPNQNMLKLKFQGLMTNDKLFEAFGTPYIMCLKDSAEFKSYFYDQTITESQLTELINSIDIIPTSYKVINGLATKFLTTMSSELFAQFRVHDKYGRSIEASKDVLLCCLLRFKRNNIGKYLKQFDGISSFIDLYNSILINEYLGQPNKTSTVRQNQNQIISNMSESNYYTIYNNCQLNITLKFKSRGFNLALSERLSDKTVQNVLKRLAESKEEDNNYLAFLFRKSAYLDAASAINVSGYKLYKISNTPLIDTMTNDHFNALYEKLSPNEKYQMIMNGLISKDLCHFIINNKYILNEIVGSKVDHKNLTFMNKYGQLVRYLFGYAWLTLYMEESIKRGYINKHDRFIFDIETASQLPYFPYSVNDLHSCPYLPILVDTSILSPEKNVLGVNHIHFNNFSHDNVACKEQTRCGVSKKENFIDKMNMFISGHEDMNLLKDVDWSNMAMTGSMMACCLPNFNPLMLNFVRDPARVGDKINFDFISYVNEYYKDADVDIMCNLSNIYEFINKIHDFKETIESNIKKAHKLNSNINVTTLFSNKAAAIMINKDFIKKYLVRKIGMEYVDILSHINDERVKKVVYEHYIKWHKEYLKKSIKENPANFINPKYNDIFDLVPIENINVVFVKTQKDKDDEKKEELENKTQSIYSKSLNNDASKVNLEESVCEKQLNDLNLEIEDMDYEEEKKIEQDEDEDIVAVYEEDGIMQNNVVFMPKINFKFRISSSFLPHSFELFQIKHDEFFSTVAKFHLPIVRSYYDGSEVYITPSCITACITLLNIDYKYFAGSKDPIEIINKYRMRGFGTILNDREIVRLVEYSNLVPKWKELYGLNIQSNTSVMKILGIQTIDSTLFKPSVVLDKKEQYNSKHNNLSYSVCQHTSKNVVHDYIRQHYKTASINETYYMSNMNTINKYGYIEPVKKWLIDAFYDFSFNKILTTLPNQN